MAKPRSTLIDKRVVGTYHCMSRCVRRARLCGQDPVTKRNYDYRKQWLEKRLIQLAGIFLIDVGGYAIMDNHIHVVLRNRPDLADQCSDKQIAYRILKLFPKRKKPGGWPEEPNAEEIEDLLGQSDRIAQWRTRFADPSWFMGKWKEPLARMANKEDRCRGHFWEGRYQATALLDHAAILTCTAYVDLNPVRSGTAQTPESSAFTSVQRRIRARQAKKHFAPPAQMATATVPPEYKQRVQKWMTHDSWLCPLSNQGDRKGFLNMELDHYLKLLDWSGRQIRGDKKGFIPNELAPILTRLDVDQEHWLTSCQSFGRMFYRVSGTLGSMRKAAASAGQKWVKGKRASQFAFSSG